MKKILFTIIDGLGDRPVKEFGNKTSLEKAHTPNLDFLAKNGQSGLLIPLPGEKHPTSEEAHFAIFDYLDSFPGRGPLDALGININLNEGDVAFRVNFGTVDKNLKLVDPRAGRIKSVAELCSALSPMEIKGIKFLLYPSQSHRAVLVIIGKGISSYVSSNDPHKSSPFKIRVKVLRFKPLDSSKEAKFTAQILETYTKKTSQILKKHPLNKKREKEGLLPANYLLIREPGEMVKAPTFFEKYNLSSCCVAGGNLYKGIGRFLGMVAPDIEGATGDAQTNLEKKIKKAKEALKDYDFVFLHIKAPDIFGEDKNCLGKKEFIEKIDQAFSLITSNTFITSSTLIVVTGDHSTPCTTGFHSNGPLPFLIYDSKNKDKIAKFGESNCRGGKLGRIMGKEVMPLVLKLAK